MLFRSADLGSWLQTLVQVGEGVQRCTTQWLHAQNVQYYSLPSAASQRIVCAGWTGRLDEMHWTGPLGCGTIETWLHDRKGLKFKLPVRSMCNELCRRGRLDKMQQTGPRACGTIGPWLHGQREGCDN